MRPHHLVIIAAALLCPVIRPAAAAFITIQDANSWARFDPESQLGHDIWVVDGWNFLTKQWFWLRVDGQPGGERSLDTLGTPTVFPTDTGGDGLWDNLRVSYRDAALGLAIDVNYNLMGGLPGSGRADLAETIRITNVSGSALGVHFFQYSDFLLSDGSDTAVMPYPNTASQFFLPWHLSETVVTPMPTHRQVDFALPLLALLNDPFPTTLTDVTGPLTGDVAWAFQWDVTLPAGASYLISKDKGLVMVPEPATIAMLVLGATGLLVCRRRG